MLLLLCGGLFVPGLMAEDLIVIKGSTTKIAVPAGIRKVIIGNETNIAAGPQDDGRAVLVVGLAEGSSDLRIERLQGADLVYNVAVRPDSQGTLGQIKELLSDVVGLQIKAVGGRIVLEGKVGTQADWEKVKKVEAAYGAAIIDLATLDQAEMARVVKAAILRDLHEAGMDAVTVQVTGDAVVLDGLVSSEGDLIQCVEKAKQRMPNVRSLVRVQQMMIETDLQFVEIDRRAGSSFGQNLFDKNITLSPSFSAANSGRPGLNLVATASYAIDAALTAKNSKSLYQEHISGASGQEVNFKQGGTVYVPSVVPVPYGVIIKVKPTLQGKDGMLLDVAVEISTAVSYQGQVTTREFRTSASVMSKVGETVVLSGFAEALGTTDIDKTPILGEVPLMNLLFANKTKSKNHKEAVLLLTPRPFSCPKPATGPAFSLQSESILGDAQSK